MPALLDAAARIRHFNRFYTGRLELLDASHLQSRFSLPEVRVLYELAHREEPTATAIAAATGMDEGYLSRLLRRFRQLGLVHATPAPADRRQRQLTLTSKGRKECARLDARATDSVLKLIRDLAPPDLTLLVDSIATVESLLGSDPTHTATKQPPSPASPDQLELRPPATGDLGWVVQRHGELYDSEYGWNANFERLVSRIVGQFADGKGSPLERCWIASVAGRRAGCVFLMPGDSADSARLRLLLVEPWARGRSVGSRLVAACIDAARDAGCERLTLWTNDVLTSARRIYERAGFRLIDSEPHETFGKSVVGQNWELALQERS